MTKNTERKRRRRRERGPSAFKRKRMEAKGIDPDSRAVTDWLKSSRNALRCITRPLPQGSFSRSMGFVYDTLPSGHHVVCTARHNFLSNENLEDYRVFVGMPGSPLLSVSHASPIYAPDEHDIAFFLTEPMDENVQAFDVKHYERWVPNRETYLYNAKNSLGERRTFPASVMRQAANPHKNERAYVRFLDPQADFLDRSDPRVKTLLEEGRHELGLVHMRSRQGCSGSPVWDSKLRLVGMNVRGTEGGSRGDLMGYVYAGDIRECYESVRGRLDEIVHLQTKG